jgi:hypothetical protein
VATKCAENQFYLTVIVNALAELPRRSAYYHGNFRLFVRLIWEMWGILGLCERYKIIAMYLPLGEFHQLIKVKNFAVKSSLTRSIRNYSMLRLRLGSFFKQ